MTQPAVMVQEHKQRNRFYALVWLLVLCACALFCVREVTTAKPFHSNLLELLPRDERNPVLHELSVLLASRFQDKLLVLVRSDDRVQGLAQAQDLQARLLASARLAPEQPGAGLQQELIDLYRPFSQQLLDAGTRASLQSRSPAEIAEQTYRELFNPVAAPRPFGFADDPFNLGGHWLASLASGLKMQEYQGFPLVEVEREGGLQSWLLVTAKLNDSPFDVAVQQDVTGAVQGFRKQWPSAQLLTSGMIFHAAAGTEQATSEINTVGLGSSLGIIAMVLLVFRRVTPLVAVMLTMTSAYVLALTVSLLVFGRIHIITLAFGSTLLGVAGDYVLHFLVGSQREGSGLAARHHLRYAMAIGALTGMGAYLLQYATPFPGLQQMAVFCSAGIFGAWMTVLALAPYYKVTAATRHMPLLAAEWFFRLGQGFYRPLWNHHRWVGVALVVLLAAALLAIARGGVNDAVINLNTSPKVLLESEQQVQQILQQASVSQFFYIEADSPEQLLTRTQQLNEQLAALKQEGLRWQSLAQYLPSAVQQTADRQLVADKLYAEQGALALLCEKLGTQCQSPIPSEQTLTPAAFDATALAELLPPMQQQGSGWRTLVTVSGEVRTAELATVAAQLEGVTLVNQTEDLSQLLGRYRSSVSELLLVTLVLLAIGLTLRYRHHSWRMLLPLVLAMAVALGCAAMDGITLFHVMALLLVIGIGLDTAVFYTEGGFTPESWLASSLACGTSILAFGLLSLSAVPVLHQFGLIILVGILGCWLLTPLFFRPATAPPLSVPEP
jgi:predicted exporter